MSKLMIAIIVADKGPVTCVLLWYPGANELGCAAEVLVVKSTTVAPSQPANIKRGLQVRNTELRMNSKSPNSEMVALKWRRLAENSAVRLA